MSKISKPSAILSRSATAGNSWKEKVISAVSDEKKASFVDLMNKLTFI
jgi:hypothetical protein